MFIKKQFRSLFAYHAHLNRLMLDRASKLTDAQFNAPGINDRSIRRLLFHIMNNDYAWRTSIETGRQPASLEPDDYMTVASLADAFAKEEAAFKSFFDRFSEEEIQADVHLTGDDGEEGVLPRWKVLEHLTLHSQQHHAELAYLLTNYGQSPGDLDYIDFNDPPDVQ